MIQAPIPQDVLKFKAKMALNLTARQCVCFGLAGVAAIGAIMLTIPVGGSFEEIKESAGIGTVLLIILFALPFLFFGLFQPYGVPLEKFLIPFIIDNVLSPSVRPNEIHFGEIEDETRYATRLKSTKKKKSKKEKQEMAESSKTYTPIA